MRYLIRKILEISGAIFFLAALTFFLLKFLPGGPFDQDLALNPLVKQKLIEHWQIDTTWYQQCLSYFGALLKADLGVSLARPDQAVSDIISRGLAGSLLLNGISLFFVLIGSVGISLLAVRYRAGWFELLVDQTVIIFLSLPSLFWGPLLIYLFGFYWNILPVAFLLSPRHYVLPVLTLSLRPLASLIRILKNSLAEIASEDYVRTAKAKGAGDWHILIRHILRNSLIPFLSYLGPLMVAMLSGSFLVEMLFAIPGLGKEFIVALEDRDYTLIMGLTLFYGVAIILVNSAIEILLNIVDPRLRERR